MKHPWPGTPGGYVPIAWKTLVPEAALRVRLRENQKKQACFAHMDKGYKVKE